MASAHVHPTPTPFYFCLQTWTLKISKSAAIGHFFCIQCHVNAGA